MARVEMGRVQDMLQTSKEARENEKNKMVQPSRITCLALNIVSLYQNAQMVFLVASLEFSEDHKKKKLL